MVMRNWICRGRCFDLFRKRALCKQCESGLFVDKMDFIGVAVLLCFVLHVEKSAESKNEIVAIAGCNVSLEWTLVNTSIGTFSTEIFDSSGKIIAHLTGLDCNVLDNSSTYCIASNHANGSIISLTILNVTARQSGNYTRTLMRGLVEKENISKKLVVIEKPKIMESWRPIIGQPFEMTCNSPCGLEFCVYRWRINGRDITPLSNVSAHSVSSLLMTDNLSNVTCQVCFNERARNFSGKICKQDACSADSDPYIIQVIYGPDNISLSLNESNFYLEEHADFTIDCFANCNPNCTFWWKGHDTIESKKLVIASVESKMAGNYTCYAKNQERNITSQSNPITLHVQENKHKEKTTGATIIISTEDKDQEEDMEVIGIKLVGVAVLLVTIGILFVIQWRKNASIKTDVRPEQYWMGPIIVSVFLTIFGVLMLVTVWRKNTTRAIDSREMCQPYVGETDKEVSRRELERPKTPLTIPEMQDNVSRKTKRLECPKVQRNLRTFQKRSDQTRNFTNQVRENVSLQTLSQASNTMNKQTRNVVNNDDSANNKSSSEESNWISSMERPANESRLVKLFARIKRDNKVSRDDDTIGAVSPDLNSSREDNCGPNLQEDPYSTIDDDDLSDYDHGINNLIDENSHETRKSIEHVFYDYARSIERCHVVTADVQATDEAYITPINYLARSFEIFQDEETDVLETDHTYLTVIDDLANPIEIRHVEETDKKKTDETYITPINGRYSISTDY